MLFDLRGRRRRTVQATYLTLAILMGGGLVFFGIGSDVSGGLADIFGERGGGGDTGNEVIEKRIERNEKRLQTNRNDEKALGQLVKDYFGLASAESRSDTFDKNSRDELAKAGSLWQRYQRTAKKPDPEVAQYGLRIYEQGALNKPAEAQKAVAILAEAENDIPSYLLLVRYASLAKDTRTADLAGKKAVDLASKGEREAVKAQVRQEKIQAAQGGAAPQGG